MEPNRGQPEQSARRDKDAIEIRGDYQYRALRSGFVVQRFWHSRKLDLIPAGGVAAARARALDVGCGSGVVAAFLAEQGATVDAVDSNEAAIEFARSQFAGQRLRFHLRPANGLDFPERTFDRIYCLEVVEHLVEDQALDLFRAFHRLLTVGGQALITTPNYRGLWPVIERLMDALHLAPRMQQDQHVTRFGLRRLEALAVAAGMELRRIGRFCGLAPFASVLSWRLAEWVDRCEWRIGERLGNLLYLCTGKTR